MAFIKPYGGKTPKISRGVYLSENVYVIGDVEIGEDSSVWFGSVIRADVNFIRIGKKTNIQDNSVIHVTSEKFPTLIGDKVTVGHGAIVHGCLLHNNILVGMGAVIMDGVEIEDFVLVGAGAVIPPGRKIPSGVLVTGVPAKIVRDLKIEEIKLIEESADNYVRYKNEYLKISS